jgi:hypothetical protein
VCIHRWVVYFEDGEWCFTEEECRDRSRTYGICTVDIRIKKQYLNFLYYIRYYDMRYY